MYVSYTEILATYLCMCTLSTYIWFVCVSVCLCAHAHVHDLIATYIDSYIST